MSELSSSLNITIQRGSCYELSAQSLLDFFQVFGKVDNLEYNEEKGKGFVVFASEEVAMSLLYKNLMIAECVVFTWRSLLGLGENPEPGLLLAGEIRQAWLSHSRINTQLSLTWVSFIL